MSGKLLMGEIPNDFCGFIYLAGKFDVLKGATAVLTPAIAVDCKPGEKSGAETIRLTKKTLDEIGRGIKISWEKVAMEVFHCGLRQNLFSEAANYFCIYDPNSMTKIADHMLPMFFGTKWSYRGIIIGLSDKGKLFPFPNGISALEACEDILDHQRSYALRVGYVKKDDATAHRLMRDISRLRGIHGYLNWGEKFHDHDEEPSNEGTFKTLDDLIKSMNNGNS